MTPKEIMLSAFEGGKPERVPVTLFGGGMWSIHKWGSSFEALSTDADKMTRMLVDSSKTLQCDIVYAGSGYNNFHTAALGGKIKFREVGAPDLEGPIISSEEDLDKDETTNTVKAALRRTKETIGDQFVVTMTAWGPFTNAARLFGEEVMMKATYKNPDLVEKILDFATELLIHLYEPVVNDGTLEVISLADPTASGDLVSKKQFERFALPYLKKFCQVKRTAVRQDVFCRQCQSCRGHASGQC
jgi:uroporphyrinogen decarboxylase